jgi:hypothetical protein
LDLPKNTRVYSILEQKPTIFEVFLGNRGMYTQSYCCQDQELPLLCSWWLTMVYISPGWNIPSHSSLKTLKRVHWRLFMPKCKTNSVIEVLQTLENRTTQAIVG